MTIYSESMTQVATYFAPGVPDGEGSLDFGAVTSVTIGCRWQSAAKLFRDAQGREVVSDAIVYVNTLVENGGYLYLGDAGLGAGADPRDLAGAREIRQVNSSPSLSGNLELIKVWL